MKENIDPQASSVEEKTDVVPRGYRLVKQTKSERMQLLVIPYIQEALRDYAAKQGTSVNDLVGTILAEWIDKHDQEGQE